MAKDDNTSSSICASQPHKSCTCDRKRKRSANDAVEVESCTLKRARAVEAILDSRFPVLLKYMRPSHVSGCFWLGLPLEFCKSYMPKQDETFTLITENGEECPVKYLTQKTGLSGGWRGFSILNRLVEGDVVLFHLVKATQFKVYIIRENELAEVEGALSLLDLDACTGQSDPDNAGRILKANTHFRLKSLTAPMLQENCLPKSVLKENYRSTSFPLSGLELALPARTGNEIEEVDSDANEGVRLLESTGEFKDIKNLESFTIKVNGLIIDSDIPKFVKTKYYELCCSQNAFLHDHLPKVINSKLVAGIISETVNIADAIAASMLTTSQRDFTIWQKSLSAFEQLGMNVGFLLSRLNRLMNIASESEDSRRYREAVLGKTQVEEDLRIMESKLLELREKYARFRTETETLKGTAEKLEQKFHAEAVAHW